MSTSRTTHQLTLQLPIDDSDELETVVGSPLTITSWIDARKRTNSESVLEQSHGLAGERPSTRPFPQSLDERHPGAVEGGPIPFRQPITDRQRKFLLALARSAGIGAESLDLIVEQNHPGRSLGKLDRNEAAALIRMLQERADWRAAS